MPSNSESASGSGCFAGPDALHLCRGRGRREFTSSVQHDEARRRASTAAVRVQVGHLGWCVWSVINLRNRDLNKGQEKR
jgi:hypothetical protein